MYRRTWCLTGLDDEEKGSILAREQEKGGEVTLHPSVDPYLELYVLYPELREHEVCLAVVGVLEETV